MRMFLLKIKIVNHLKMNRKSFEKKITRSTARAINESKKEQPTVQAVSTNKRKVNFEFIKI